MGVTLNGSVPLITSFGDGTILSFSGNNKWTFQSIAIRMRLLWPSSPIFDIGEASQPAEVCIWDGDHQRLLLLALGKSQQTEINSVRVQWKWAQGFVNQELVHLFTDQGYYLIERPESQWPYLTSLRPSHTEDELIPLKALKLSYKDFFLCNTTAPENDWNTLFRSLIYAKPNPTRKYLVYSKLFWELGN